MSALRILIMAGGTGGHVFPALAVAGALRERGAEVRWLGTRRGLEARLVPAADFPIDYIGIAGLRGTGLGGWLLAPFRLMRALGQALAAVYRFRPGAVLGMGGFVSGPGGVAARLLGRPLLIHEQNAVAGLTNRLLAPVASRVMTAFPGVLGDAAAVGNPVRPEIAALEAPEARYRDRHGRLRLLVIGGSQGAVALNRVVPAALAALPAADRPEVIHQAGERNLEIAREAYRSAGVGADVRPFLDDMAAAYDWADLVVCRAGALTVSELAAAGIAAVLVPFPYAVDDHQSGNAAYLADAGAAILAPEAELTPERLVGWLREFIKDAAEGRKRLGAMASAARSMAKPNATVEVARACLQLAAGGKHE